jgi:hypothetical protein
MARGAILMLVLVLVLHHAALFIAAATGSPAMTHDLECARHVVVVPALASLMPPAPPPRRRLDGEPFFAFVEATGASRPETAAAATAALAALINGLAASLEAATGRRLFPVRAEVLGAGDARLLRCGGSGRRPLVSWDPRSGRMIVRLGRGVTAEGMMLQAVAANGPALPVAALFEQAARRLAADGLLLATGGGGGAQAAVAAVGAAVTASLAAVVPFWQCVACVAVLGLLAPLAINALLGAAVDAACAVLELGPNECFDLALGALFAGVVLAALAAAPIFRVCRLAQCGRPAALGLASAVV